MTNRQSRSRRPGVLALTTLCVVLASGVSTADELCEATVNCWPMWGNDELVLPANVVTLASEFEHCSPTYFDENYNPGQTDTVSVMFVIDHSASMGFMDSTGSRYALVERLIDSLYAYSPASEVGIAVFSNQLMHNYTDDPYYVPLDTSNGWPDSYVPLTRLDATVGSMGAVEKLKESIALSSTTRDLGNNWELVNGYYGLTGRHDGRLGDVLTGYNGTTDISLAFDAVRQAFTSATYDAEHQFVVFLSDGEAQNVDEEREPYLNDYIAGTNMPTTFTAFWINQFQPIPEQIDSMTANVRSNGYSTNNINSTVWRTSGAEDDLFDLLLRVTQGTAFQIIPSYPVSMSINGISAQAFDSTHAYFDNFFALTGDTTVFNLAFTYHYELPWDRDSTRNSTVTVIRSESTTDLPSGVTTRCWEQGTIGLYIDGTQISAIDDADQTLQVRFTPPTEMPVSEADLTLSTPVAGDELVTTTINYGNYFAATFDREFGDATIDNVVQNGTGDSIVVTYRNPDIPLDTLRIAVPVTGPRDVGIRRAYYLDQDADGYPDVIRVVQGADVFTPSEDSLIQSYIQLQTTRSQSVTAVVPSADGFDIVLGDPAAGEVPWTGVDANERLYIDEVSSLPSGGSFPGADIAIADSMAPVIVSATYFDQSDPAGRDTLEVVFSEDMDSVTNPYPFRLSSPPDVPQYEIRLSHVRTDTNTSVFFVVPVVGQQEPQGGDSIWINPTSTVQDLHSLVQDNPDNVRRLLDYYLLYTIEAAVYLDTNNDGLIDIVNITTDIVPDDSLLAALYSTLVLPEHRSFSYTADDFSVTDSGFQIAVTQASGSTPYTGVDDRDILTVSYTLSGANGVVRPTTIDIEDNLRPVVVGAKFVPGEATSQGEDPPDTLVVTLSEPVGEINDSTPFIFYDVNDSTEYMMVLVSHLQDGQTYTFIVVDSDKEFPDSGDLVSLDPTAQVTDNQGNVQDQPNEPVPLQVGTPDVDFEVYVAGNPLNLNGTEIDPDVRTRYDIAELYGQPIVVVPLQQLPADNDAKAIITILDAVGNVVVDSRDCGYRSSGGAFVYVWDGTNRQGRQVGIGTYLAVITVKTDETEAYRVKLGVTRR